MSKKVILLLSLIGLITSMQGQSKFPPPWGLDPVCNTIVTDGVAAFTTGASTDDDPLTQNFTLGMMRINDIVPATDRLNVTNNIEIYRHPSWHIDSIGNVFGIIMDDRGNTYVTASSNYSPRFAGFNGHEAILKYGTLINGDPNSPEAAGAIYKIDAKTGQASHFTSLPQQEFSFQHVNDGCDRSGSVRMIGPGLGNITYRYGNDQAPDDGLFYVTNFGDRRIYRINTTGEVLDSYDPLFPNDSNPSLLADIPYGITIGPDSQKLFFGTADVAISPFSNPDPRVQVRSIDLNENGSFNGNETIVFELPFCSDLPGSPGCSVASLCISSLIISDLEFLPSGQLLVGTRTIFDSSVQSANSALSFILQPEDNGSYELMEILVTGSSSSRLSYGGVSYYSNSEGAIDYVLTSADMSNNSSSSPHGIHVSDEDNFTTPINPAAIISYGGISDATNGNDPDGIGGDVYVFKSCTINTDICLTCLGDINGDNAITLLDVQPFVDILNNSEFNPCADINGDGAVNLLDVQPFVDILTTNSGPCNSSLSKNKKVENRSEIENAIRTMRRQLGMKEPMTGLIVFPNPASNIINVQLDIPKGSNILLNVYNVSGQKVITKEINSKTDQKTTNINVSNLSSGLYFIEASNGSSIQRGKFIVSE